MAEIFKKPLFDPQSNKFLENRGFINIANSFDNSAWKHPSINMILGIPFDHILKKDSDLWKLFYVLGAQSSAARTGLEKLIKDINN